MGSFSLTLLFCLLLCFRLCSPAPAPAQTIALFRIRRALEYPTVLQQWNRFTNFCSLPISPNLSITCSGGNITELTIVGDRPNFPGVPRRVLSSNFSVDSLFSSISDLPAISNLTLVSLGMWGQLPPHIGEFQSLRILNLSSNFMYKEIPNEVSKLGKLKRLDLGGNFFKGSVPDLTGMVSLEELDLGRNRLGPEFPVVGGNIITLAINNNSFKATLPTELLKTLSKLQRFDGSSNKLFGKIPSFLFSLPTVNYIDLSGNRLAGTLPESLDCAVALRFVDVSNNKLVGRLPKCLRSNGNGMTVRYSWNCLTGDDELQQHSDSYCNEQPLAVAMPNGGDKKRLKKSKSGLGIVLGIVGGVAGGVILVGLMVLVVGLRITRGRGDDEHVGNSMKSEPPMSEDHDSNFPKVATNTSAMSPEVRFGMLGITPYRIFDLEELEDATNNFDESNLLQERSQVQLYKGRIEDGSAITIRRLKLKQRYAPQVLNKYMDAFSKLKHRHLVSILGHCIADGKDNHSLTTVYLVFEHASHGTLRSHLTEWRKREMLKWPQRVQAVIGVARGIQFLHSVTVPGIYGNDIKTENILLDETLTAKIHNYNLPLALANKNYKVGQELQFNALREKDTSSMKNGDKEDIYQLGLILLEVITGKTAATESDLEATKDQLRRILSDDQIDVRGLTDPSIEGTFAYDSLKIAVEVALDCLSAELDKRPSVDDILWNLQYSVQVQDGCASIDDGLSIQSYN